MSRTDYLPLERRILQKCVIFALFSFGIMALIFVLLMMLMACNPFCKEKKEYEKTAVEALKMKVDDPSSLKVLAFSDPDSVFQNRFCPEEEIMQLSERFLQYSVKMMQDAPTSYERFEDKDYLSMLERFNEGSNTLTILNGMLEKEKGVFCGWRVRVKYSATDRNKVPYESETWFIFDRDKNHILKTLEIPSL